MVESAGAFIVLVATSVWRALYEIATFIATNSDSCIYLPTHRRRLYRYCTSTGFETW
jgi:hypothetical protein